MLSFIRGTIASAGIKDNDTYGEYFLDTLVFFKLLSENGVEMPFSGKEIRNDADHVDVSIETVGLEAETSKDLESISEFL